MPSKIERLYFGSQASPVASNNVDAGDYVLDHDGNSTLAIAFSASDTDLDTAIEGLASIGAGNMAVTAEADGFTFTYGGALADTDVPADFTASSVTLKAKADTVSATTTQNGSADVAEVQQIDLGGCTTTFDLTYDVYGPTTVSTLDASGIQGVIDGWLGGGVVTVADLGGGLFSLTWSTAGFQPEMSISNAGDGSPSVSTTTDGATGQPQIVTVTLPDNPTEGTLNVTLDGSTSSDFAYSDTSPAAISGWTGGGSAGNWTYTRDTNAADVSASGAEGSTPLRYDLAVEIVVVQEGSAGGATYTLDCDAGAFSLTGIATGLTVSRLLACSAGSFTLTGIDAALSKQYALACDAGAFTLTGVDAGLVVSRLLGCSAGSFTLTGVDAAISKAYIIACDAGAFALTGNDAALVVSRVLDCSAGSFALTGIDAEIVRDYLLTCDSGSFSLTGNDASLAVSRVLGCDANAFMLTGNDAALTCSRLLDCSAGSFALTGNEADLLLQRVIDAAVGEFVLTGIDAVISRSLDVYPPYTFVCWSHDPGAAYAVTHDPGAVAMHTHDPGASFAATHDPGAAAITTHDPGAAASHAI